MSEYGKQMFELSRSVIFINTFPPSESVELLKLLSQIEKMSDKAEKFF